MSGSKQTSPARIRTVDDGALLELRAVEQLGEKQSITPEGFLICRDVPVARVGELVYVEGELPLEADRTGLIRVTRGAGELFDPAFVVSLNGKPVVDLMAVGLNRQAGDHPDQDVTPTNWRELSIGTMINARPGEPPFGEYLLADLLIMDERAINLVRNGKRGVSLGYDAEYTQIAPGRALQRPVTANHIAITASPRCGPRCSIGDAEMSKQTLRSSTAASRDSVWSRIRKAFNTRDAEELESALKDADGMNGAGEAPSGGAGDLHVHVYGNGADKQASAKTEDEDEADGAETDADKAADEDRLKPIMDALETINSRLDKLEGKGSETNDSDDEGGDREAEEKPEKKVEADDKSRTGDSSALMAGWQKTIAAAEILVPGIKVPTLDARAARAKTMDAMCGFRRETLRQFGASERGRDVLGSLEVGDVKSLSCDAIAIVFRSAAETVKAANNTKTYDARRTVYTGAQDRKGPPTPAEMNARHREHYGQK